MAEPAAAGTVRPIDYPSEWPPGSGRFGPNARQALAHQLAPHVDELLYGGARGGGKTDFALAEALRRLAAVEGMQAVFFRRTYKELSGPGGAIPRLLARIPRNVARWNGTERRWRFYNGSALTLSYLDSQADVQAWLGLELQLMVFDQVEQIDEETYVLVRTSLRSSGELAQRMNASGLRPSAIATANPGGRGHGWVKRRFIDPFPRGGQMFRAAPTEVEPQPMVRVFVPAKLTDNPALDEGDPTYRARLQALGTADRAAQLEGDWDVFKGARFADFRTRVHVRSVADVAAMIPPPGAGRRGLGIDYGNDSPFVGLWGAVLPDNLLVIYREVWRRGLSPAEQAELLLASETERGRDQPVPTVLDPACWAAPADKPLPRTGGRAVRPSGPPPLSIAWHYQQAGLPVRRADNRRRDGAALVASLLRVRSDGLPRLIISEQCTELIRTLPQLQRSPTDPEDVQKGPNDHWYDALRYLAMDLLRGSSPIPDPAGRGRGRGPDTTTRTPSGLTLPSAPTPRAIRRRGF